MQFSHQHRDYCRRLVLISSGGLGADVGRLLRLLSLPGAELVLPIMASRPAIAVGNALRRSSDETVTRFSETWRAYAALSSRPNRQAFLRTLRSVIDHRGQAVCALNRLHFNADLPSLIICGEQDRVIPVAHAYAAHAALPNSRLHVIPDVWHHPQVECPETVASLIDELIAGSAAPSHRTHYRRTGQPPLAPGTRATHRVRHLPSTPAKRPRIAVPWKKAA
jgi:pimeloyl-ACP methyl ester carboxylesterase